MVFKKRRFNLAAEMHKGLDARAGRRIGRIKDERNPMAGARGTLAEIQFEKAEAFRFGGLLDQFTYLSRLVSRGARVVRNFFNHLASICSLAATYTWGRN